jgi:transposase
VDTREDTITNIGSYYGVNQGKLNRHYKNHSSGFKDWTQKAHAEDYLLFPQNIGQYLSIDEVSLSQGELYTFVTNKAGKGKQGTLVASIKGTLSKDIIDVLLKLSVDKRLQVKEVTLDMAKNMEAAVKIAFTNASLVTDRFHVVKLAMEALQHMRIKERWNELDKENEAIKTAKEANKKYEPEVLENGDTPKQLLARCRYILAKKQEDWTVNQKQRAAILFKKYPHLQHAYHQTLAFRNIYEDSNIASAKIRFTKWIDEILQKETKEFYTVANTVKNNLENILNFFINRNTNANAESFNSKIKLFRANQRGVVDITFFLFRLNKLFA